MPDIDIDFCTRGRGAVIQYVTEKYGRAGAQIITFGTLGARAALKTWAACSTGLRRRRPYHRSSPPAAQHQARKHARWSLSSKSWLARNLASRKSWKSPPGRHARNARSTQPSSFRHTARELVPLYKTKDEIVTQYDMVGLEKLAAEWIFWG
jgi:DNA polymerase-3 subunit alpha